MARKRSARKRKNGPKGTREVLLQDLQQLVKRLEDDLRERSEENEEIGGKLRKQWEATRGAHRTAQAFAVWRDDYLTQVAVAWVLGCVFVRTLEDNALIGDRYLAGEGDDRKRAEDSYRLFIREDPLATDREYLEHVFRQVGEIPAARELFAEGKTLIWSFGPSGDGAKEIRRFFSEIDPGSESGALLRRFAFASGDTRFLGDLYQDLSESARKKYALLQTPEFVEEFILDYTLTPAIEEFGLEDVRMIDPTCGSGHFLLGAFRRLLDLWQKREPGTNPRELAQRALDAVHGIDINPFAVAIARFRLIVAAMTACGIERLEDSPDWMLNVAAGDSLLYGVQRGPAGEEYSLADEMRLPGDPHQDRYLYAMEEPEAVQRILKKPYHVVVGNPPYITVKDKAPNAQYRKLYESCHRQYSLGVPFTERFFGLASPATKNPGGAGYVGMITANSFMKREFGKKLIEELLPKVELTHLIDTSGAYIPGHGTPTVILHGRNRKPVGEEVRAVMGIRGEPSTPEDAAQGLVWRSIVENLNTPGAETDYVSVTEIERKTLGKHPWSIGGGGAAELKELLESEAQKSLGELVLTIGRVAHTGSDEAYVASSGALRRRAVPRESIAAFVEGDKLRDWALEEPTSVLFPYASVLTPLVEDSSHPVFRWLWPFRDQLWDRTEPNGTHREIGKTWYEFSRFHPERFRGRNIAFAFVATHNHFVLDRGGKVFKQSAPIIKLPPEATEEDHLALLGLLNSSTAGFWMRQVFHCKGAQGINEGGKEEKWEQFFEYDGTKLQAFPVSQHVPSGTTHGLDRLARNIDDQSADSTCKRATPSRAVLAQARDEVAHCRVRMIALQEELDWECYGHYGLLDDPPLHDDPPPLALGQRAFEIVMARKMVAGELETAWFERHGSTPISELPDDWPEDYKRIVERRIELIETDKNIGLIEQPEYKRRWNTEPWEKQEERALRSWLLDRLETERFWPRDGRPPPRLRTCAQLAEDCRRDPDFLQVAAVYRKRDDFDLEALVTELVSDEAVPFLPVLRYKPSGFRKRQAWEETWALQRREDAGEDVGDIPVPPKYASSDLRQSSFWRLRGKLDVPKERWVSYPFCERSGDPSPVVTWAGYDHLQQATALAAYYQEMKERDGWAPARLVPLLAGLDQLVPWLLQWHNELDPDLDLRMGEFYRSFVEGEARALGFTVNQLSQCCPAESGPTRYKAALKRIQE